MRLSYGIAIAALCLSAFAGEASAAAIAPSALASVRSDSTVVGLNGAGQPILTLNSPEFAVIAEFPTAAAGGLSAPTYFTFYLRNIDRPAYNDIGLYIFAGNGTIEGPEYYERSLLFTTFSDFGALPAGVSDAGECGRAASLSGISTLGCEYLAFSIDVTGAIETALDGGWPHLGLLLGALDTRPRARYNLMEGSTFPTNFVMLSEVPLAALALPPPSCNQFGQRECEPAQVTEPFSLFLLLFGAAAAGALRRRGQAAI